MKKGNQMIFLIYLLYCMLYFEGCKICNCKRISSIIWTRNLREFQEHHERLLNLEFFGKTVPSYPLLYLKWSKFNKWYSSFSKGQNNNTTSMCYIDTISHIAEEKKPLNSTYLGIVGIEELSQICLYLEESVRKGYSCTRLDDSILDNTSSSPLLLEKSKTNRRESWIKSENYHNVIRVTNCEYSRKFYLECNYIIKTSSQIITSSHSHRWGYRE